MPLSDLKIKALKPTDKRREIPDANGLRLRVATTGRKTFVFRYQFENKHYVIQLGVYPALSLAAARAKLADMRLLIDQGINPHTHLAEQKVGAVKPAKHTVATAYALFLEQYLKRNRQTWAEDDRAFSVDVLPHIGQVDVDQVSRRDLHQLFETIVSRGSGVMANRVHGKLVTFWRWMINQGIVENSPVYGMDKPVRELPRERVLTESEIYKFWHTLPDTGMHWHMMQALRMTLITGQRPGEVAAAEWKDFDLDNRVWSITLRKGLKGATRQHMVPINDMQLSLLQQLREMSPFSPFLFPSYQRKSGGAEVHILEKSMSRALLRKMAMFSVDTPFKPHDLRRTVRTELSRLRVPEEIAEHVIGHSAGKLVKVYNRYEYLDEKREALQLWSAELDRIINSNNDKQAVSVAC